MNNIIHKQVDSLIFKNQALKPTTIIILLPRKSREQELNA